jgi:SulP family sulfate permease
MADLRGDLFAGATVGIVAVPLAMALAIASGVPPQHGLYTAIIAGGLIALLGGSRFSVSGPTAAFVVILLPIAHQYGIGGLLVATVMSGLILIFLGIAGLGRLIQYIPYPVTTGFTAGIGVVIATIQIKDFLGLTVTGSQEHYLDRVTALIQALPTLRPHDLAIGVVTLTTLLIWRRLKLPVPAHLVALTVGALAAYLASHTLAGFHVDTIGSRFSYTIGSLTGHGIPPLPPMLDWPWNFPNAQGLPVGLSWAMIQQLVPAAFTIAMLGAIESLLCAVVADGLTDTKHHPNGELVGQGIGNVVAPFFGGITATAAIARTATSIRSGARSPLAAMIHAAVVLLAVIALAPLLSHLPMASLAALLFVVAWDMSEAKHFVNIVRTAPKNDVAVLLACFSLTVLIDMVIAVGVGIVLASLLFIRRMADLTGATLLSGNGHPKLKDIPAHVAVYEIKGPIFFGAAEKAMNTLQQFNKKVRAVIIDMTNVPAMDMTGMVALESLLSKMQKVGIAVVLSGLKIELKLKLNRVGIVDQEGCLAFSPELDRALEVALRMRPKATSTP